MTNKIPMDKYTNKLHQPATANSRHQPMDKNKYMTMLCFPAAFMVGQRYEWIYTLVYECGHIWFSILISVL